MVNKTTVNLTLATTDGLVLDRWDVHWDDDCEDENCPADFHIEDLESLVGVMSAARRDMADPE